MYEIERAQGVALEVAILVRVVLPADPDQDDPLDELEGLARTAGTQVVGGIIQRRDRNHLDFGRTGNIDELHEEKFYALRPEAIFD